MSEFDRTFKLLSQEDVKLVFDIIRKHNLNIVDVGIMFDHECECSKPVFFVIELECDYDEWGKVAKQLKAELRKIGRSDLARKVLIVCSEALKIF